MEANPILCEDMRKRFADDIKLGRAFIVSKAIDRRGGGKITLHVNSRDSAQGTAIESYSQRALARGGDVIDYDVPTVSLSSLIEEHGKAHYIKIDIEGMDGEAIAGLSPSPGSTLHFDRTSIVATKPVQSDSAPESPWLYAVSDG